MLSKYCFFHKTDSNQYIVFNSLLFEPIVIEEKEYLDLRDDNLKVFSDEELALLKQKGIIVQDDNTDNLALKQRMTLIEFLKIIAIVYMSVY